MKTEDEIKAWLVAYMAKLLDLHPTEIGTSVPFNEFGLDSASAVGLSGDLGRWLGLELKDSLVFDHPTIDGLGAYVCESLRSTQQEPG